MDSNTNATYALLAAGQAYMDDDAREHEENIILDDYDDNDKPFSGSQYDSGPNHMGYYPANKSEKNCRQRFLGLIRAWMLGALLINILLIVLYIVFKFIHTEAMWSELPAHKWLLFSIFALNSYILIRIATHFLKVLLEALFFTSIFFFYIYGLGWSVAVLLWDFFWWFALRPMFLEPLPDTTWTILEQAFLIFLAIAIVFVIKTTLAQFVIGRFNKATFWKKISHAVFKERVLQVLLAGSTGQAVTYAAIKQRYSGIIPNFNFADLQQNIAINAKLKAMRKGSTLGLIPTKKKSIEAIEKEVIYTADAIYTVLDKPRRGHVILDDFKYFFLDAKTQTKAYKVFKLHDRAEDVLTKGDFEHAVRVLFRDRKILAKTLQNRQSISGVIITTMDSVAWVVVALISLWILDVNYIASLVPLGTALLALSFVFGNSVKNAFEAFLFLFFVKAYDVGDRIGIDGETVIISKINLLSTYAYTTDGRKIIIPTRRLSEATIVNFQRSRNHVINISVNIGFRASLKDISDLRQTVADYIKAHSKSFNGELFFALKNIEDQTKMQVDFSIELKGVTWASPAKYLNARTELLKVIKEAIKEFEIPTPKYDIDLFKKNV
jgi:small-conductance mechanosensitive channel